MQRKDDKAKKQMEALERKQQNKVMLEKEMEQMSSVSKGQTIVAQKVTRAEILSQEERRKADKEKEEDKRKLEAKNISVGDDLLTENVNRLEIEGDQARTVDEALKLLGATDEKFDKNPEKRC
uniref:Coiled-coil domain-containing protein n=1 Tax=Romanomermis culicivorax TaxID=13658 RepID=A0A915J524_ROMCU